MKIVARFSPEFKGMAFPKQAVILIRGEDMKAESHVVEMVEEDKEGRVISIKYEWPTDRTRISKRLFRKDTLGRVHKHGNLKNDPEYALRLAELPENERRALLEGRWDLFEA